MRPDSPFRAFATKISVPVLLVGDDRDRWFATEVFGQTAQRIPLCTLRLYPGKDHVGAISSERVATDVAEFVRHEHQVPQ